MINGMNGVLLREKRYKPLPKKTTRAGNEYLYMLTS